MSRGMGGVAKMILQDSETVIYEYYAYDLNDEEYCNPQALFDGLITIDKRSFVEPEPHEKLKKQPNGKKKLITKSIIRPIDYTTLIKTQKIQVKNSKFCWAFLENGIGFASFHLINKIYTHYQEHHAIPERIEFKI